MGPDVHFGTFRNTEGEIMLRRMVPVLSLLALTGCASVGPGAVEQGSVDFNHAVVRSVDTQFLLNLVRLKYRDNPYFVQVGSVTESLSTQGSLGISAGWSPSGSDSVGAATGMSYSRSPTIVYQPLQGQDFLRALMRPVAPNALLVLSQSGWSIQRLFGAAVERMNGLHNAPSASGPTPDYVPRYERFARCLVLLRELQKEKLIDLVRDEETGEVVFLLLDDLERQDELAELRELLGLDPDARRLVVNTKSTEERPNTLNIRTRSIFGILFYLSQNVEVPSQHADRGLVTVTRGNDGREFDWDDVAGHLLKVYSSTKPPEGAATAVPYRGSWFYIRDDDLNSKSTFMLLTQLFNLLAGETSAPGPTLTIPVG